MVFPDWLQARLTERGWSPAEAGRALDINASLLSRYLNGRMNPSRQTMRRIAAFFGVPFDEVLGMVEEQERADALPRELAASSTAPRGFSERVWELLSPAARERIVESARIYFEEGEPE